MFESVIGFNSNRLLGAKWLEQAQLAERPGGRWWWLLVVVVGEISQGGDPRTVVFVRPTKVSEV
jgi:hypothetical protein